MKKQFDIAIIGAGPAGLTAALYAARANLSVAIFEKGLPGGQINSTAIVENYPSQIDIAGMDLAEKLYEQVENQTNVTFIFEEIIRFNKVQDLFILKTESAAYQSNTAIIATGSDPKTLHVTGSDTFESKGISYCAVCDGNFFENESVIVVGGGDSAIEEAAYLANIVKDVTILVRKDHLRAQPMLIEQLKKHSNVSIRYNTEIQAFKGDTSLTHVTVQTNNGSHYDLPAKGTFIYIGHTPHSKLFQHLQISDENGWIETTEKMETTVSGLYAVGDIRKKDFKQIVTATSDGAIAAKEAYHYIESRR